MPDVFKPHPDWKMAVYGPARQEMNACIYYRMWVPMEGLRKQGLANCWLDTGHHHFDPNERDTAALEACLTFDIDLFYAMAGEKGKSLIKTIQEMKPGKINDRLIYPPSVVYDIDDNLDFVHPFNPTFAFYGVRAADGHLLEPGEDVRTRLADGREIVLWQDGVTQGEQRRTFRISENHAFNKTIHEFAAQCDGFTTPSRYLRDYMRDNHGYPEGYVFPNSIIPEDWRQVKLPPRKKNIRILWQGGGSHMSDWYAIQPALKYIAKKYPHVTFVFFGADFSYVTDTLPPNQVEKIEWVPFGGYRPTRVILDCDINLCVLRDDDFSRSKSAIKFYEGSLLAKPEATLAANMPPYNEEIVDGETGLLYEPSNAESFAANLEHLIQNVELRRRLGENAKRWVLNERHYFKTTRGLYDYYYELRCRRMKEMPYDPEADKLPPKKEAPPRRKPTPTKAKRKAAAKKKRNKR